MYTNRQYRLYRRKVRRARPGIIRAITCHACGRVLTSRHARRFTTDYLQICQQCVRRSRGMAH